MRAPLSDFFEAARELGPVLRELLRRKLRYLLPVHGHFYYTTFIFKPPACVPLAAEVLWRVGHPGRVEQEPVLLPGTVAGNIAYGRPTASAR